MKTQYPYVTPISWQGEDCACTWTVALGPDDETWTVEAATKADALQIAQMRSEFRLVKTTVQHVVNQLDMLGNSPVPSVITIRQCAEILRHSCRL